MMTLVRICGEHWHAVERDLIALGFRKEDVGTPKLSFYELVSIVVASPPGSAVYHAETRGDTAWTPEAQLLASLRGQPAQADSQQPVRHNSFGTLPDYGGFKLDALPADELVSRRAELADKVRASGKQDRAIRDVYRPGQKPVMIG
jgi:hypothetical protein